MGQDAASKRHHCRNTNVASNSPNKEMAIYQYHLTVIPRQSILRHWDIVPVKVQVHDNPAFDEDDLINVKWWNKEQVDFGTIEKRILSFANKVEWTKKFADGGDYGDNDTSDISIHMDETGHLDEFSFRIDLRDIDKGFSNNVLTIAKNLNTILLDRQGNLFEPTHENLADNIRTSNAFKFVTNPTDFLNKLGKNIEME